MSIQCNDNNQPNRLSGSSNNNSVYTFADVADFRVTNVNSNLSSTFTLFPIPANNAINFTSQEVGTLEIVNLMGETVLATELNSLNGSVNLSGVNNGTYVYKFTSKTGQSVGKLIKQ